MNIKKYIDFILDLLTIEDDIEIKYDRDVKIAKFVVYDDNKPCILLNDIMLTNEIEVRYAVTHELRHYYQWLVVYNEEYYDLENKSTRSIWKDNFKHYVPYKKSVKYTHQPLEVDAVCFTQLIMMTLYNIIMDDFKKNDLTFKDRLYNLSLDFTKEEIIEVMKFHGIKNILTK